MTEQNPPAWINGTTISGESLRRMNQAIMGPGVARTGDLRVTEKAGTPSASVDVAVGGAFVAGTTGVYQGTYFVESRGVVNKPLATPHGSNPRIDLVVARVRDNAVDSSGVTAWDIHVVTGTAAGSPVAPAVPANCLPLASVAVAANATAITNAHITPLTVLARPWNSAWGVVATATRSVDAGPFSTPGANIISAAFAAVAGRRYRTRITIPSFSLTNSGAYFFARIVDETNTALHEAVFMSAAALQASSLAAEIIEAPAPGTRTRHLRVDHSGAGTATCQGSAQRTMRITVEDIGPA